MDIKRALAVIVIIVITFAGGPVGANTPNTSLAKDPNAPYDVIENIKIPYYVSLEIQMEYPAHSIVGADKVTHNNKKVYRLEIDDDIEKDNKKRHYLFFDRFWQKVDEKEVENFIKVIKPEANKVEQEEVKSNEKPEQLEPAEETDEKPEPQEDKTGEDTTNPDTEDTDSGNTEPMPSGSENAEPQQENDITE